MCELLALSFNEPVKPNISFRGFRKRGIENPDGWGIGYFPDKSVEVIKEPVESNKSELSDFIKNYSRIKSKIFISHVRRASKGSESFMNTHPFQRELNGDKYIFAHNGTISNFKNLALGNFEPVGETDSEHVFCHILNNIKNKDITKWEEEDFEWLSKIMKKINDRGRFNCLLTDGEFLFSYHDQSGYNGLWFVKREAPFNQIRLKDEDIKVNLSKEKNRSQSGFIITTEPLTDENWKKFQSGELRVFKDGKMIFSN